MLLSGGRHPPVLVSWAADRSGCSREVSFARRWKFVGSQALLAEATDLELGRPVPCDRHDPQIAVLIVGDPNRLAHPELLEQGRDRVGVPDDQHLLGGPSAEPSGQAGDVLAHDLAQWISPDELTQAGTGAILAIGQAGAYGAAMASVYNGRLRPAEAVIEGGALRLSRRRETLEDLTARDV